MATSKNNMRAVSDLSLEEALKQNTMPTPEQWVRIKFALQDAFRGDRCGGVFVQEDEDGSGAIYITIHPCDYDEIADSLEFTSNDDGDLV